MRIGRDRIEVVSPAGARLGEGPVWDARIHRLAWVDILASRVNLTDVRTGATDVIPTPLHVGAVALRASGGYIAALQNGFWVIDVGNVVPLAVLPDARPDHRFNDGKCDPAGRFWAGTLAYDESVAAGALYRLDGDGTVTLMLDGVSVSNGLAWSADGQTMFFIDSPTRRIDAFAFEPATGEIADRRPIAHLAPESGYPDGMTIDAEGGLWVAVWRGSAVHRYRDGVLDVVIDLPVSLPTSCTFGGDDLDELYITSASEALSVRERAEQPLAGSVFRVRPGVQGLPPVPFADA